MSPKKYQVYTLTELRVLAEERDCELIEAQPDELLLDIDAPMSLSDFRIMRADALQILQEKFGYPHFESWASRNGGLHVRILLPMRIPTGLAIALQASLGSDPRREILACWEHFALCEASLHEDPIPDIEDTRSLFKPKGTS